MAREIRRNENSVLEKVGDEKPWEHIKEEFAKDGYGNEVYEAELNNPKAPIFSEYQRVYAYTNDSGEKRYIAVSWTEISESKDE